MNSASRQKSTFDGVKLCFLVLSLPAKKVSVSLDSEMAGLFFGFKLKCMNKIVTVFAKVIW
jgi:hypothetical protein